MPLLASICHSDSYWPCLRFLQEHGKIVTNKMSEIERSPDRGPENVLSALLRRKLGRLADMAAFLAASDQPLADGATQLQYLRDNLTDIIVALNGENGDPQLHRLRVAEYPDTPFYNGILDTDPTLFDTDSAEIADTQTRVFVVSDHYLYFPDTEKLVRLTGDPLFTFNALLKSRGVLRRPSFHMKYGFRPSTSHPATRQNFRDAAIALRDLLTAAAPEGFDPYVEEGQGQGFGRMLTRDLVVIDKRGDREIAQLAPNEDTAGESEPITGMTVAEISAASGAPIRTVRDRFQKLLGDAYIGRGELNILPMPQAQALVAELRAERAIPLADMPEGWCRVNPLLNQVRTELGVQIALAQALDALRAADLAPAKLNVDPLYTHKGGVWCVRENGALDALRGDPKIGTRHTTKSGKPTPTAPPTPAERKPAQIGLRSTADDITTFLAANGYRVEPSAVIATASDNPLIKPEYDSNRRADVYSYRSSRRIIEALTEGKIMLDF